MLPPPLPFQSPHRLRELHKLCAWFDTHNDFAAHLLRFERPVERLGNHIDQLRVNGAARAAAAIVAEEIRFAEFLQDLMAIWLAFRQKSEVDSVGDRFSRTMGYLPNDCTGFHRDRNRICCPKVYDVHRNLDVFQTRRCECPDD